MYYGHKTKELEKLCKQYEDVFGYDPNGEMEVDYGEDDYNEYIQDLKKAIKTNTHIAEIAE